MRKHNRDLLLLAVMASYMGLQGVFWFSNQQHLAHSVGRAVGVALQVGVGFGLVGFVVGRLGWRKRAVAMRPTQ